MYNSIGRMVNEIVSAMDGEIAIYFGFSSNESYRRQITFDGAYGEWEN